MEKYIVGGRESLAHGTLRAADVEANPDTASIRRPPRSRREDVSGDYDVTGLSLPNAFHAMHRVPVDGEYVDQGCARRTASGRVRAHRRSRCGSTTTC